MFELNESIISSYDYQEHLKNLYRYKEGACFQVFDIGDTALKFQYYNDEYTIMESHNWLSFCLSHNDNPFIPKIIKHKYINFSDRSVLVVEVEKLIDLNSFQVNEIKDIFRPFFNSNFIYLDNLFIESVKEKIKKTSFVNNIDDRFFIALNNMIIFVKNLARHNADISFYLDLHFNNLMIRPSTNQLIINDFFCCD